MVDITASTVDGCRTASGVFQTPWRRDLEIHTVEMDSLLPPVRASCIREVPTNRAEDKPTLSEASSLRSRTFQVQKLR